jgi:Fe2+-dicitrate sensor, membrane component
MANTNQRLSFLFGRFIAGACTQEELQEFWQLVNESKDADAIKQQLEQLWKQEHATNVPLHNADALYTCVRTRAIEKEQQAITGRKTQWMAAASVLLLITATVLYELIRPAKQIHQAVQTSAATPDVAPGGNKAILTLADGSSIVLDEAGNGTLATQGNASVVKTDSGQLVYKVAPNHTAPIAYNTLSTPRGGQFQLILPDGSKVWLNAASSIRYPATFAGNARRVEITGEVYFEVVKNARLPFIVSINKETEIAVLGTHFNVNAYADEASIKTTLLEGSVQIVNRHAATGHRQSALLKPGQQAVLTRQAPGAEHAKLTVYDNTDIAQVMAWKNGIFNFHQASLQDVMRQLSRWYDITIEYENGIPDMKFGGKMGRDVSLAKLLYFFKGSGVQFRIENAGKKLVVTR